MLNTYFAHFVCSSLLSNRQVFIELVEILTDRQFDRLTDRVGEQRRTKQLYKMIPETFSELVELRQREYTTENYEILKH